MKVFYEILVVLHVIGVIAIGWGIFSEVRKSPRGVNVAMLHGASLQVLTGILMVGIHDKTGDEPLSHATVGIKLLVALAMLGVVAKGKRAAGDASKYWTVVLVLWLVNVVLGSTLA